MRRELYSFFIRTKKSDLGLPKPTVKFVKIPYKAVPKRQRLIITEAGRDYLTVVRDALDRIAIGTERLLQRQNAGVLTVSTSPDFAAKWLVHRLGHFAEAHSGIDLRISATLHHVDFAREEVD